MSDFDLDLIRAWAAGHLSDSRLAEFEASMAADPELSEFASAWKELDAYTDLEATQESDPKNGLRSALTFEALENLMEAPPAAPWTPLMHVAAGALLVLGTILGLHSVLSNDSASSQASRAGIPRVENAEPMDPDIDEQLALLRDYRPTRDGQVQWLDSIAQGQRLARSTGLPMLLWCVHQTCPYCQAMRETTLLDPDVQDLLLRFVPVQLNVMKESRYSNLTLENGFPMFEVVNAELEPLHRFFNYQAAREFQAELSRGLDAQGAVATLSWERWSEAVGVLLEARTAERAGRLGQALAGYQLMGELGAGLELSRYADRGTRRLSLIANRFLDQAERNADPSRVYGGAAWTFRGSRFEGQFRGLESESRKD